MKNILLHIFFAFLIISGLFFLQKKLEIFVFSHFAKNSPDVLLAQAGGVLTQKISENEEYFVSGAAKITEPPEFEAKSVFSLKIDDSAEDRIFYQKEAALKLPIASLTKLMTAVISLENYNLSSQAQLGPIYFSQSNFAAKIMISKEAIAQEGAAGEFETGENILIENLILSMLIESSNDAAWALAEKMGVKQFVEKMNLKAKSLEMSSTNFINPTGLNGSADSSKRGDENYSTGQDLAKLVKYIIKNQPQILEITAKASAEMRNSDGSLHHKLTNTNELLVGNMEWKTDIAGGKTGYNANALGCLLLVLENKDSGYLINIILGSQERFREMESLIYWVRTNNLF